MNLSHTLSLLTIVVLMCFLCTRESRAALDLPVSSQLLDKSLDLTPVPRPPPSPKKMPSERRSPWTTPTKFRKARGLRYGVTVHREEQLQGGASLGLAQFWQSARWWDVALAADLTYPLGAQLETQIHRVFSRSLLKPSLFVGLTVQPEPKNGLAFLIAPETTYFTFGFSMQDEWKEARALKVEFSGMSGLAGETKFRTLIYYLKLY